MIIASVGKCELIMSHRIRTIVGSVGQAGRQALILEYFNYICIYYGDMGSSILCEKSYYVQHF